MGLDSFANDISHYSGGCVVNRELTSPHPPTPQKRRQINVLIIFRSVEECWRDCLETTGEQEAICLDNIKT